MAAVATTALFTATSAAMVLGLQLLGRSVTHELHIATVTHSLASKLVVEIHEYLVVGHLDDLTLDAHAFLCHHGHAGTRTDILGVKLAIDMENLLL